MEFQTKPSSKRMVDVIITLREVKSEIRHQSSLMVVCLRDLSPKRLFRAES